MQQQGSNPPLSAKFTNFLLAETGVGGAIARATAELGGTTILGARFLPQREEGCEREKIWEVWQLDYRLHLTLPELREEQVQSGILLFLEHRFQSA